MQELITYLIKSAGLMSLFFAAYFFLLKDDTNFKTNRIFLFAGILTSFLLPFLEITRTVITETTTVPLFLENFPVTGSPAPVESSPMDWWQIAGITYLIGLTYFLLKFLYELFSLLKLLYTHKSSKEGDFRIIQKAGNTQPFSFFRFIVIDRNQHTPAELEMILKHEHSHARQWHSVDQLVTSLAAYLLWFNPLAWLYRKSVVQNLEYLADKEVIAAEVSKKEYQKTLLKISTGDFQPVLTNQFYQSFIKKRIIMLNKNASRKSPFWKVSAVLPFLFLFVFLFNIRTIAQVADEENLSDQVTSEVEIAVTISKDTRQESLANFEKIFNKRGTTLQFSDIEYSDSGLLTAISVSYNNKAANHTGQISLSNPAGIRTTVIFSGDKGSGFRQPRDSSQAINVKARSAFSKLGKNPLFMINNEMYPSEKLYGKYIQVDGEMSILDAREALEKYGSRGADGVVIIPNGEIISNFKAALKKIDSDNKVVKRNYIHVKKGEKLSFISLESNPGSSQEKKESSSKFQDPNIRSQKDDIPAIHRENSEMNFSFEEKKPLIVINGKVQDNDFNFSGIDPSSIKSLKVLKEHKAVEKYGEKAKNGVLEIELKSKEDLEKERTFSEDTTKFRKGKGNIHFSAHSIRFEGSENGRSTSLSVRDVGSAQAPPRDVLYVVNGKEMPEDFDAESISAEDIESINVLKGDKATAIYGEKGSKGVVEINTGK